MERMTNASLSRTVLANNQRTLAQLATYQVQLSSGKRVNAVSDDPIAAKQSLRLRTEDFQAGTYIANIDRATSFLDATDSALDAMVKSVDQVKQSALQGANGTQTAASRKTLAQAVDAQLTRLIDLGNTVHDGRSIFAGNAVQAQPFARTADGQAVLYQGDLDAFAVRIGPRSDAIVNQNGYELLKEDGDVFAALIAARDALADDDATAVRASVAAIDRAHDRLATARGDLGARQQRLDLVRGQLENSRVQIGELISANEDADFTAVVARMQQAQVALEAGLQAGTRIIQPTLLDFLR